jgi:hypothetical protein
LRETQSSVKDDGATGLDDAQAGKAAILFIQDDLD